MATVTTLETITNETIKKMGNTSSTHLLASTLLRALQQRPDFQPVWIVGWTDTAGADYLCRVYNRQGECMWLSKTGINWYGVDLNTKLTVPTKELIMQCKQVTDKVARVVNHGEYMAYDNIRIVRQKNHYEQICSIIDNHVAIDLPNMSADSLIEYLKALTTNAVELIKTLDTNTAKLVEIHKADMAKLAETHKADIAKLAADYEPAYAKVRQHRADAKAELLARIGEL